MERLQDIHHVTKKMYIHIFWFVSPSVKMMLRKTLLYFPNLNYPKMVSKVVPM